MTPPPVTTRQALDVARTGAVGSVNIGEPWVYRDEPGMFGGGGKIISAPGLVDLAYLRTLRDVRAWTPEDAR